MAQEKSNNPFDMLQGIAMSAIPDDKVIKLDNQLCFALYVCSKEIIRKIKPMLEEYNLTYTGYITLMALCEKDDVNVKELGSRLYLDSGTLTPLLKKLEAQGYLSRVKDKKDERNMHIQLTMEGRALKDRIVSVPKDALNNAGFNSVKAYLLMQSIQPLMDALTADPNAKPEETVEPKVIEKEVKKKTRRFF